MSLDVPDAVLRQDADAIFGKSNRMLRKNSNINKFLCHFL